MIKWSSAQSTMVEQTRYFISTGDRQRMSFAVLPVRMMAGSVLLDLNLDVRLAWLEVKDPPESRFSLLNKRLHSEA